MKSPTDENSKLDPETTTPAVDPGTASGVPEQAQLEAVFSAAIGGGNAPGDPPAPARKPGCRGPDKQKRKTAVSVGKVVERADPPLFTSIPAVPLAVDFEGVRQPVDDTSIRAGIAGAVRILESGAALWIGKVANRETGNAELAARMSEAAKPSPEVREALTHGGVECWKKYFPNTPIGPEFELVGALGLWGKQLQDIKTELRALGKAQREKGAAA